MGTMVKRMRSDAPHVDDAPRTGRWRRMLMITVVFAIVATACGGGGTTVIEEAAAEPTADASAENTEPAVDPNSANLRLTGAFDTFGGPQIDLATVQDSDVVLWLWAPW